MGIDPELKQGRILWRVRQKRRSCRDRRGSPLRLRRTSAGVPSAIFSPWSSTMTWSASIATTSSLCSISTIVRPWPVEALDLVGQLQCLGRVHAGRRLVEQQQLRLRGERPRDLGAPPVGVGEAGGEVVGARQQPVAEQRQDLDAHARAPPPPRGGSPAAATARPPHRYRAAHACRS